MPFDGGIFNHPTDAVPDDVRLLDRARELIATDNLWIKRAFSMQAIGHTKYCLYGALFQADRELFHQLPLFRSSDLTSVFQRSIIESTVFGRVHLAINREARPLMLFWSTRNNFAIRLNDHANSLSEVHDLMDRTRARLLRQSLLITA